MKYILLIALLSGCSYNYNVNVNIDSPMGSFPIYIRDPNNPYRK